MDKQNVIAFMNEMLEKISKDNVPELMRKRKVKRCEKLGKKYSQDPRFKEVAYGAIAQPKGYNIELEELRFEDALSVLMLFYCFKPIYPIISMSHFDPIYGVYFSELDLISKDTYTKLVNAIRKDNSDVAKEILENICGFKEGIDLETYSHEYALYHFIGLTIGAIINNDKKDEKLRTDLKCLEATCNMDKEKTINFMNEILEKISKDNMPELMRKREVEKCERIAAKYCKDPRFNDVAYRAFQTYYDIELEELQLKDPLSIIILFYCFNPTYRINPTRPYAGKFDELRIITSKAYKKLIYMLKKENDEVTKEIIKYICGFEEGMDIETYSHVSASYHFTELTMGAIINNEYENENINNWNCPLAYRKIRRIRECEQ